MVLVLTDTILLLTEGLDEGVSDIRSKLQPFSRHIVEELTFQCAVHLKQVNDIPRLYRRTNRDVPTKASLYVGTAMKPVNSFLKQHRECISSVWQNEWANAVVQNLSEQ